MKGKEKQERRERTWRGENFLPLKSACTLARGGQREEERGRMISPFRRTCIHARGDEREEDIKFLTSSLPYARALAHARAKLVVAEEREEKGEGTKEERDEQGG